jgi:hypothetical protein
MKIFLIFASNRLLVEFETEAFQPISLYMDKSQSFDNGRWNIFFTSTTFIDKLRAKAVTNR